MRIEDQEEAKETRLEKRLETAKKKNLNSLSQHTTETMGLTEGEDSHTSSTSRSHVQNNKSVISDDCDSDGDQKSYSSDVPVVPATAIPQLRKSADSNEISKKESAENETKEVQQMEQKPNGSIPSARRLRQPRSSKIVDRIPLEDPESMNNLHFSCSSSSQTWFKAGTWVGNFSASESQSGNNKDSEKILAYVKERENEKSDEQNDQWHELDEKKMPAKKRKTESAQLKEDIHDCEQALDDFEDEYIDKKKDKLEKADSNATIAIIGTNKDDKKCGAVRSNNSDKMALDNTEEDESNKKQKTSGYSSKPLFRRQNSVEQRSYSLLAKYLESTGVGPDEAVAIASRFASDEWKVKGESKEEIVDIETGSGKNNEKEHSNTYARNERPGNYNHRYSEDLAIKRAATHRRAPSNNHEASGELDLDAPASSLDAEENGHDERNAPELSRSPSYDDRPGAVHVSGRAAGQIPSWVRPARPSVTASVAPSPERPSTNLRDSTISVAASTLEDGGMGEMNLIEATRVSDDDETIVFATADPMPSTFKLFWRDRRVRILLVFVFLLGGIALSIVFGAVLDYGSSEEEGEVDAKQSIPTASPTTRPTVNPSAIKEVLVPLSGEVALNETGSPQHSAMIWLANYDETGIDFLDDMFPQRYAMTVLYFATSMGDSNGWSSEDNWLEPAVHECDWGIGIACKEDHLGIRHIFSLDLTDNGLSGIFPAEMRLFKHLEVLRLSGNNVQGEIPETIGQLTKLTLLDLGDNNMKGTVPNSIINCQLLRALSLNSNAFHGNITDWFYDLKDLREVDLSDNNFNTPLSSRFADLTRLVTLNLQRNQINGTLPLEAFQIPDLAFLHLDDNLITGSIPSLSGFFARRVELTLSNNLLSGTIPNIEVTTTTSEGLDLALDFFRIQKVDLSGNSISGALPPFLFPSIVNIDLSFNEFTGTIPLAYGFAPKLEIIDLSGNMLNGTIPQRIGYPDQIRHILLSNNKLTGVLPKSFGNFVNLEMIHLHRNPLSGEIPSEITSLEHLTILDLRRCNITGQIPENITAWKKLRVLDLGNNGLTGTIPDGLGQLTQLTQLELDHNSITGKVPGSLSNLDRLEVLTLQNNKLTGTLPTTLSSLKELEKLYINNNDIEGQIPQEVCSLSESGGLVDLSVDCKVQCSCCSKCFQ